MISIEKVDTEKFTKILHFFKNNILKSEALRIGASVFFGLVVLLTILPHFLNNSSLKFQISQKLSQISGANVSITGDVKVSLLPVPTIVLEGLLLQNYKPKIFKEDVENASQQVYNLYAKFVKIKLPVFKFSDNSFANKVVLVDAVLESYEEQHPPSEHKNKLGDILAELAKNPPPPETSRPDSGISAKFFSISDTDPTNLINIPNIIILDGEAIFYDHLGRKREIKSINAKTKNSAQKINSEGSFSSEEVVSNFELLAKFNSNSTNPDSFLKINSPVAELSIKGNFTSDNHGLLGSDFKGSLEGETSELKSFYKTYISSDSIIFNKLEYNAQSIKISAEIENKFKEISINNLVINSNLVNGKGSAIINLSDKIPLIDINLDLDSFDLDQIWSDNAVATVLPVENSNESLNLNDDQMAGVTPPNSSSEPLKIDSNTPFSPTDTEKKSTNLAPINFDFTNKIKDFDLNAEIKIASVKYLDGEITDVDLYLTVSRDGEILILPMIFKIPGGGILRVNGALDNTAQLPKFVGKLDVSGTILQSVLKWLKIESQNLKFENLKQYNIYSDLLLSPNNVTFNNFYLSLNNGSSEFLGELKIDTSGKMPAITSNFQTNLFNIDDYFLTSGQNAYLSPGLLMKKLLWLNDIASNNDLGLKFDKLIYKGEEFHDQSMKLRFGRGYIEIVDLDLQSEQTDLKANLSVDISDKKLKFGLDISADSFHYETIQAKAPPDKPSTNISKNRNFFDQFFALPSLEGFYGKISLVINSLKLDDLEIQNIALAGKLEDGNINDATLNCDLYGGKLQYKGLLGAKSNKVINGNLSFTNVLLQPFLSDLVGIKNVSGVANISANVTATADKKEEFAKSLSSEIKFNANAPTVSGYGLTDLVNKMFSLQRHQQELQSPEKILLNPESKTVFQQASGTIQLNGGGGGKLRTNITAPAINGILSGTIDAPNNNIDVIFNAIFLTGSRQKHTPINIATNLKGNMNNLSQSTNLDQVNQYLSPIKPIKASDATSKIVPEKTIQEKATSFFQELIN